MNKLSHEKRCVVIRCLVEGNLVRATVRITGVSKNAVQRLTKEIGKACLKFQDKMLRNLNTKRVECDEVWCFSYAKDKNVPDEMRGMPGVGSIWTWTAIDAESKLIISWRLSARDAANAHAFCTDLAERVAGRVQVTTDGNRLYVNAMDDAFHGNVDYAQLVKIYLSPDEERQYSPGKCLGPTRSMLTATRIGSLFRPATRRGKTSISECKTAATPG